MWILCLSAVLFYCYAVYAAITFARSPHPQNPYFHPPVSVLKPLCGADDQTYTNLAAFCQQDYPEYQIIFGVRDPSDPCIPIVEKLIQQFPQVDMSLVVSDRVIGTNLKVSNLANIVNTAKHDIFLLADSDIRVGTDYLQRIIQPLQDEEVGVVTCLYRSSAKGIAAYLEAIGTATDFHPGVLVSQQLEGIKFAFGSTIVIRKTILNQIGGFSTIADYLADDFQLGYLPAQAGYKVILSDYVVDHILARSTIKDSFNRQLRWTRCIRVSRPWGYLGLVFTFGTVSSLLLLLNTGGTVFGWTVLAITWLMRLIMGWLVGVKILNDPVTRKFFWIIPLRDLIYLIIWCLGFVSNTIEWRGQHLKLIKGGKLVTIK